MLRCYNHVLKIERRKKVKSQNDIEIMQKEIMSAMSIDVQVNVLFEILNNVFDEGTMKARIVKYKLQKYIHSGDIYKRVYAISKIVGEENGVTVVPNEKNVYEALEDINTFIAEELAKRYVQRQIEEEVEANLAEKQDKYIDEVRLSVIKKKKGPENAKTLKKYAELEVLDTKKLTKAIQSKLRPSSFEEIVGQERAIKSLISKISSPYPQHIILYGPPGVGKTTAARIALKGS